MKLLLTGITGLVGASFVTATLRNRDDIQIVAICRSGRGQTAQERVKQVIEEQCAFDGTPELAEKMLGKIEVILDMPDREYTDRQKAAIEHCAHSCPVHLSLHPDVEQVFVFNWKR